MADYRQAGVDRAAADRFVTSIAGLARSTHDRNVVSAIGGYASLYRISKRQFLAASTDGVGTKLKLAFDLNRHDTVGIDLVAMSVNDLLCVGARPAFFLDYFATGKLRAGVAKAVLRGIVAGCREASCALVGGETAEMPGFYPKGEYDLAGFAVGLLDAREMLPKKAIPAGAALIGLPSSGFHSNGFSLLRKYLPPGRAGRILASQILAPTRIYARGLETLLGDPALLGLSHVTGSGFQNVPRVSEKVSYAIDLPEIGALPPGMPEMLKRMKLPLREEATTFNCGIGMVLVVKAGEEERVLRALRRRGEKPLLLGETMKPRAGRGSEILLHRLGGEHAWIPS